MSAAADVSVCARPPGFPALAHVVTYLASCSTFPHSLCPSLHVDNHSHNVKREYCLDLHKQVRVHTLSDVSRHVALHGACVSFSPLSPGGLPVFKYRLRDPNRHVLSCSNIVKLSGPLCLLLATVTRCPHPPAVDVTARVLGPPVWAAVA